MVLLSYVLMVLEVLVVLRPQTDGHYLTAPASQIKQNSFAKLIQHPLGVDCLGFIISIKNTQYENSRF